MEIRPYYGYAAIIGGLLLLSQVSQVANSADSRDWKMDTPIGIQVQASQKTIKQYEEWWDLPFEPDLERIDDILKVVENYYGAEVKPWKLRIVIKAWNMSCPGFAEGITRFISPWGCIQGSLGVAPSNTIKITLGRNSGQGEGAYCNTPLAHEIVHWVSRQVGQGCNDYYRTDCELPSDWELGLCK